MIFGGVHHVVIYVINLVDLSVIFYLQPAVSSISMSCQKKRGQRDLSTLNPELHRTTQAHEYTDLDNFGLYNPLLVGIARKFLVCNAR